MAIDITSQEYQEGRERLYEHVNKLHNEGFNAARGFNEQTNTEQQQVYVKETVKGYHESIDKAHRETAGSSSPYADPNYAAGAKAGVRDWEQDRLREAERETVKVRVA